MHANKKEKRLAVRPDLPKINYDQRLPPSLRLPMEGSLSPLVTSYIGTSPSC